jgi:hypothetical protein
MAKDWGLKITKPGKSTTTTDPRDMLLSSAYQMFKYHGIYTASATFNPGDRTVTTSITHGLGYVPAFVSYGVREDDGSAFIIPSLPYGISEFDYAQSWADTQKIYFKVTLFGGYEAKEAGWNELIIPISDFWNTYSNDNSYFEVGREGSTGYHGALRFASVPLTGLTSISSAKILIPCNWKTNDSSRWMRWRNYGIDEDNTQSFNNPMDRNKTTATSYQNRTVPTNIGDFVEIDCISMLNEIRGRAGWSSGNAMGFLMTEDGSDDNAAFASNAIGAFSNSAYLDILKSGTLTVHFKTIVFKDKIY